MGNTPSANPSSSAATKSSMAPRNGGTTSANSSNNNNVRSKSSQPTQDSVAVRASKVVNEQMREWQAGLQQGIRKLEENDHPAAQLLDSVCGPYLDSSGGGRSRGRYGASASFYSEDISEDDSRTISEDDEADYSQQSHNGGGGDGRRSTTSRHANSKRHNNNNNNILSSKDDDQTMESASYLSQSEYEESQAEPSTVATPVVPKLTKTAETAGAAAATSAQRRSGTKSSRRPKASTDESSYEDTETSDSYQPTHHHHHHHHHQSGGSSNHHKTSSTTTSNHPSSSSSSKAAAAVVTPLEEVPNSSNMGKPLASAFAKRCYFTKQGIGKTTQHYEGLTLTGNVVLMLASAMKLKGCPTICDEDLRRVEQTYPNQFSRLPDELLLSSGWRRISKYCHFSHKPIPDGIPFFHSRQRLHPSGGYYFLLAAAVGMVRPIDVEPLTRDTLVLLETDYPSACDSAPKILIQDPDQWTLVDKFCFFSGGPINTDEDVYYQADFDGNPIFMLAFLSPSLTPAELYKLDIDSDGEPGLKTVAAVEEVESVYDLTERDFDDLRLYHLGPCRALPQYLLQPQAWTKVLPPHFLDARDTALLRAHDYELRHGLRAPVTASPMMSPVIHGGAQAMMMPDEYMEYDDHEEQVETNPSEVMSYAQSDGLTNDPQHAYGISAYQPHVAPVPSTGSMGLHHPREFPRHLPMESDPEDEMADAAMAPMDEAIAAHAARVNRPIQTHPAKMDPPDDEPPSLSKKADPFTLGQSTSSSIPNNSYYQESDYYSSPDKVVGDSEADYQGSEYYNPAAASSYVDEVGDDGFLPSSEGEGLSPGPSEDTADRARRATGNFKASLPPPMPRGPPVADLSQTAAMRGAQEMLRRTRLQRQQEMARRKPVVMTEVEDEQPKARSPRTDSESGATWESGSEVTSIVSGSSVWTDHTNNPDRSSRRALILQMAKARMKNTKHSGTPKSKESRHSMTYDEEEKKLDHHRDVGNEIDLTEDLD